MTSKEQRANSLVARTSVHWFVDVVIVSLWQLAICALVRTTGFRAISDDDYARVVIAAEFVTRPSWDPSGTSWLPFPFLLNGSAMTLFGSDIAVARGVAITTAVVCACLLYSSGRVLGASRAWALGGSCACAVLPYAALLSVATVPEYLSASTVVFAASTLTRREAWLRTFGALSLLVACASRYEAWPVAATFAAMTLHDAWKSDVPRLRTTRLLQATLSLFFPLFWLAHGVAHHGNALFFVSRVVDYKRALGDTLPSFMDLTTGIPRALLFAEPEPILAAVTAWIIGRQLAPRSDLEARLFRAWLPLGVMVATLIFGAARGGAPTHHSERALLACWLMATLTAAVWMNRILHEKRVPAITTISLAIVIGFSIRQSSFLFEREPMIARGEEEALGQEVKRQAVTGPIALQIPDYGYFAIIASAGVPQQFAVLERHDPRELKATSEPPLDAWIKAGGCTYISEKNRPENQDSTLFSTSRFVLRRSSSCQH